MTGKTLVIAQQKGGSGKTTLTAHLAVAFASKLSVAILDVDPQGSLGQWFEIRERRMGEDATGLVLRTASGWGAKREARTLARDHDLVLIDMPPRSDLEARNVIESADLIVIPVQPTPVDLWATQATLEIAERGGPPAVIVINRAPSRAQTTSQLIAKLAELGAAALTARIGNRVAFGSTMGIGSTVMETFPGSKAAEEIEAVAAELQEHLGGSAA